MLWMDEELGVCRIASVSWIFDGELSTSFVGSREKEAQAVDQLKVTSRYEV